MDVSTMDDDDLDDLDDLWIEVSIPDPDLVVTLDVDFDREMQEMIEVELRGRSPDLPSTFPLSITFYLGNPEFAGNPDYPGSERYRILTLPTTDEERDGKMGCRIALSDVAMRSLLSLSSSGHRKVFNFSATPDDGNNGFIIRNFEFHLEPMPDVRSLH